MLRMPIASFAAVVALALIAPIPRGNVPLDCRCVAFLEMTLIGAIKRLAINLTIRRRHEGLRIRGWRTLAALMWQKPRNAEKPFAWRHFATTLAVRF